MVDEDFPNNQFKIIYNNKNLGFAEGNNVGVRVAKGKYVVFLNNDTEVDRGWLNELVGVMEMDETIGAAQSKLLLFDRKTIDSTGDFINFVGKGWLRGYGEVDRGQYDHQKEIFSARGACMIIRKKLFLKVDGFDSDFFMGTEDIDLCWRVRLNGYKVVFVPKSIVYHFGSGTRKEFERTDESYCYNIRNSLFMLIKNLDLKNSFVSVSESIAIELVLFLASLPFPSTKTYNLSRLKALFWSLMNFRCIWVKRLKVQNLMRKVSDDQTMKMMIKSNLPIFEIIWRLLYKNKIDYNYFLNGIVVLKNKWLLKILE